MVFRGKKLNFSHWFFFLKKTKHCDNGATVPKNNHEKQNVAGQQKSMGPTK